jgi:hypothetical protein
MSTVIQTFTRNSFETIFECGGDFDWPLSENRARNAHFLVCCHSQGADIGAAFLVGKICSIEPSKNNRYIIKISEAAAVNFPKCWDGKRNPVRYTTLETLGIDLSSLKFEKLSNTASSTAPSLNILTLTIAQAKEGLARQFGVNPENIEISIKA